VRQVWVGKFRAHVGCLEMGQTTLTLLGTAHAAPLSFIIGWEPPGPALPWDSVGFKGTWKGKARSLGQRPHLCPPCPLLLPFPHLAGWVTPLLSIKLSYLTPTTCSAWIFPFGAQNQNLLMTDCTSTINISNTKTYKSIKFNTIMLLCNYILMLRLNDKTFKNNTYNNFLGDRLHKKIYILG
jgi:hypothetical protein